MKEPKLPLAKHVLNAIAPLADWYRRYKPEVNAIAVDALTMQRIEKMIAAKEGQGFGKCDEGHVHFCEFRIYVAHNGDPHPAPSELQP